jgi:transcription elongation factor Elf1
MGIQHANEKEECPIQMYKAFKKAALEHKRKHFDHWRIPTGESCERCPHCEKMSYCVAHVSGGPGHITFFACKGCGMTFHYRGEERKSAKEMHVQYQIAARKYSARIIVQREEPIRGSQDSGRSTICGLRRPD